MLLSRDDQIMEDEAGGECSTHGRDYKMHPESICLEHGSQTGVPDVLVTFLVHAMFVL
jgi:hypothetical protein